MASRYAILPRSSIEVVHLPFHRGYRCLCSVTAAHSIRRGMARPRPFRCLFQFLNSFLLSLASGGEERTYTTKHGTTADLKRTVIPLARSFERGPKTGVTAPGEAFAPLASVSPAELGSARGHPSAASPVSRSVQGFKRDDDVRRFRLVKLETSRVVIACGFTLAACSPTMPSLDFMKSAPQSEMLAIESEPPGAEAKTSLVRAVARPAS